MWLIRHWNDNYFKWHRGLPRNLVVALFLLATLSSLWTVNPDFFVYKWLLWLPAVIVFIITLSSPLVSNNEISSELNNALKIIFMVAVLAALVGVAQYLFGLSWFAQSAAPGSLFANKNMATHIMVLIFPIGFYLLCFPQSSNQPIKIPPTVIGIGLALILSFVFYTATRAAWLSFIIQLLLIGLYFYNYCTIK